MHLSFEQPFYLQAKRRRANVRYLFYCRSYPSFKSLVVNPLLMPEWTREWLHYRGKSTLFVYGRLMTRRQPAAYACIDIYSTSMNSKQKHIHMEGSDDFQSSPPLAKSIVLTKLGKAVLCHPHAHLSFFVSRAGSSCWLLTCRPSRIRPRADFFMHLQTVKKVTHTSSDSRFQANGEPFLFLFSFLISFNLAPQSRTRDDNPLVRPPSPSSRAETSCSERTNMADIRYIQEISVLFSLGFREGLCPKRVRKRERFKLVRWKGRPAYIWVWRKCYPPARSTLILVRMSILRLVWFSWGTLCKGRHTHYGLGNLAEMMADWERAMASYESALKHNPYSINALSHIASLCRSREQFAKVWDKQDIIVS